MKTFSALVVSVIRRFLPNILLSGLLLLMAGAHTLAQAEATPEDTSPIVVFDLAEEMETLDALEKPEPAALRAHYDKVLLATCLQGLVNRDGPRLFVRYNAAPDDFWFARMTEAGNWLEGRPVEKVATLPDLLARFPSAAKGLVVWDERVPATSNVAATLAGVEDLLAVRFDEAEGSLYRELTTPPLNMQVHTRLIAKNGDPLFTGGGTIPDTNRQSSGSAKNDAYIWLLENFIKRGKTHDKMLGYYIDAFWLQCAHVQPLYNHTLNNLDFLIANRAAIVDLNVWEDEAPVDDPKQKPGTDVATFREILMAMVKANEQKSMLAVFGFPPWAFKYTDTVTAGWSAGGNHPGVATEWKFSEFITAHNGFMDADALGYSSFPNGSFYANYKLPEVIPQDSEPTRERLIEKGILDPEGKLLPVNYYAHYQGDFDATAWVYRHFPDFLPDPARGTLPLSWAINPTLATRFPFGMHYIRRTSKPGEVFVAGEAAGYLKPSLLQAPRPEPGLPDALDLWVEHNSKWYKQWDLHVTGFSIDGTTPPMNDRGFAAYQKFSPGGIGLQRAPSAFGVREGLPFAQMMTDLPGHRGSADMGQTAEALAGFFEPEGPHFVLVRSILQTASYYADIQQRLLQPGQFPNKLVDMPTLFWLIKEFETNPEYQEKRPKFADAKSVSATPGKRNGLTNRRVADGIAKVDKIDGQEAWLPSPGPYLYFDVANDFAQTLEQKGATVRIQYVATADGTLGMEYDARGEGGAYKAAPPVTTDGTSKAETAEFRLEDAAFSGRLNASSDFRLNVGGSAIRILEVEVTRN